MMMMFEEGKERKEGTMEYRVRSELDHRLFAPI